jgi:putative ABC transport system permease protein
MDTLLQDIRQGIRMLAKNPGFTLAALLTLSLGIGANTAIFSVIEGVLLRPLPYPQERQLVNILGANRNKTIRGISVSFTKLTRVQEQSRGLEEVGAYYPLTVSMANGGVPEQIAAIHATANLFHILGVKVAQGRGFLPEEDRPGGADVAILSDGFWHSHFGGNPESIGRAISMDGRSVTVVGVLPADFRFPFVAPEPDVWFPRVSEHPLLDQVKIRSGAGYLTLIGRLRPGQTLQQEQAELDSIDSEYRKDFPGYADAAKLTLVASSLQDSLVGTLRPSLLALLAAVGLVLLIGCANVASLLLSRTTARSREFAVRRALGASRWRLVRQLLTESLVLSLAGGALGVALAAWGLGLLRFLPAATLPRVEEVRVDTGVLFFTLALGMLTGIAFGLAPALEVSRRDLHHTLKEGSRGSTEGRKGGQLRAALVVMEVALSLVLLTGTGLLIRSFAKLLIVNPGFDAGGVQTFSISLPPARYSQPAQQAEFYRRLIERIQNLPGVQSAGMVSQLPLSGGVLYIYFCPDGTVCQGVGKDPIVAMRRISPAYFTTMRIPLLRGRVFDDRDAAGGRPVAIINETTAEHYFSNQDAIGKHLLDSREQISLEIVGVVGDVRFNSLSVPDTDEMYLPEAQRPAPLMTIVVRTTSSAQPLASAVRRVLKGLDGDLPISNLSGMEDVVSDSVAQPRLTTECAGVFAALALGLTLVGIYGVMAYAVTQRIPELGLRVALGAQRRDILRMVLGQGMWLVLGGVGLGLAASLGLTRLLSSLLFNTSATDPLTFAGVALLLCAVALLACYVPARRATLVDPLAALRHE